MIKSQKKSNIFTNKVSDKLIEMPLEKEMNIDSNGINLIVSNDDIIDTSAKLKDDTFTNIHANLMSNKVDKKKRYPADCFRKSFSAGKMTKARLYAAACGVYAGELNGHPIGNFFLAPGITDYRKRVQYQIILGAMEKNPDRRFQSAEQMLKRFWQRMLPCSNQAVSFGFQFKIIYFL